MVAKRLFLLLQESVDFAAPRYSRLSAGPRHGNRRCRMRKPYRIMHRHAFQPRGNKSTVEGVTCGNGVNGLYVKTRNALAVTLFAIRRAAPA